MTIDQKDLISIVISYYNLGEYIEETVQSVINQSYPNVEVVLVNDGSTDYKSIQVLTKLKKKYKKKIKFIDQENKGLSNARNTGIKSSSGEYICCVDADDIIDPAYLRTLHHELSSKKHAGVASSWVKLFGKENYTWETHEMTPASALTRNSLCGSSLFRKSCWKKIGGYDENMKSGYEDWDFWISLTKLGFKSIIIPKPLFKYRIRENSMLKSSNFKRLEILKYMINKHRDLIQDHSQELYLEKEKELIYLRKINNENEKNIEEKEKSYKELEYCYYQIWNSKKWKIIYKISNIFNKYFPKNSFKRNFYNQIFKLIKVSYKSLKIIKQQVKVIKSNINNIIYKYKTISFPIKNKKWPTNKPLISVIIPCFNYGNYIKEAINSVLNQTFQNFEIIIVDGGSTDISTIEVLKKIKIEQTKIYFRKGRHLVGDNRNFGINLAKGKYICCLDPDDILKPTYLEKALFLLETQNYDLVSTSIESFGDENKIYYQIQNPTLKDMLKANHISTIAVFKKKLFKKTNGYHDWGLGDKYVYEDWSLWLRMSSLGARFYNIIEPLMLYRIHGTNSLSNNIKNKTREEQLVEIIKYNKKYINKFSYIKSKIVNKFIKYKVDNKFINVNKNHKIDILFALPFTVLGGADKIFTNLVYLLNKSNISSLITTSVNFDNSLHDTTEIYQQLTKHIYHLPRFLSNQFIQKDFIDYLIETYHIKIIFLGGSQFFYDNLEYIKNNYPTIKIIDIQFNTDIHFQNNLKHQKYIDHVIAENIEVYQKYLKEGLYKKEQIDLISYGVETDIFNPSNIKIEIPNYIPKGKFIVSYIGRLSEEKNPEFLIRLAEKFKTNNKIFFILAGPGPLFQILENKIKSLGLNNIYMPGTINSAEYLSFTDLLILPSIIDGNPIVIKEAFSMGVPVVASNVGGIPYLVKNYKTGFLCESNNINQFLYTINKIMESPKLLEEMKHNCRSYAIKYLDLNKVNQKFLKLFKKNI